MHREDSIPRVGRWVNQIHGSATRDCYAKGGCLSVEPEKMRPIAGNDRPILISPRGSVVEALSVWEGASTNGLGTVGGLWGAAFIACATCSGTCNVAYLP